MTTSPADAAGAAPRSYVRALLDPQMPGMDADTPRASPWALLLMLSWVAAQAVGRYHVDALRQIHVSVHLLVGLAVCLGIFTAFHGVAALKRIDRRAWFTLGVGTLCLVGFWSFGRIDSYRRYWQDVVPKGGTFEPVYPFMYFATCAVLFRLVTPFTLARVVLTVRPGELGLRAKTNPHPGDGRRVWPIYLLLFLGVFPFVVYASTQDAFLAKYPMARPMIRDGGIDLAHLLVYEGFYAFVFISGESFWRGWWTFGTERRLGLYGLAFMVVPYVCAHYGKPLPETLGAILAGVTLGWLALKHRSVWLGVALHYGVALSMDLLAIYQRGLTIRLGG